MSDSSSARLLVSAVRWVKGLAIARAIRALLPAGVRETVLSVLGRAGYGRDAVHEVLRDWVNRRLLEASQIESEHFEQIQSRTQWEEFVAPRLQALRSLMGVDTEPRSFPDVRVTRRLSQAGVVIENLLFESHPDTLVTANLYRPTTTRQPGPGVLVCHSHHAAKTQDELQDLGMAWARSGCLVLIMDLEGHGERRHHPFHTADDYPHPYRVSRQDYWFRYNTGMQLYLAGESLMGWMVADAMRGIDLLVSDPGVEAGAIVVVGSVAGGGDVAAITAALDDRVSVTIPFNFGKVGHWFERERDSVRREDRAVFSGLGSWESSRNLIRSARDGFTPWLILASLAPRRLIYAHEFGWEPDADPVWRRLRKVYSLYQADEHLAVVHGRGQVSGRPPHNTHCTNVGRLHRREVVSVLDRWVGLPEKDDPPKRKSDSELQCLPAEDSRESASWPLHQAAARLAERGLREARNRLRESPDPRAGLCDALASVLGSTDPSGTRVHRHSSGIKGWGGGETVQLECAEGLVTVIELLRPPSRSGRKPVVVGIAQEEARLLRAERRELIAGLIESGAAVAIVQPPGTGTESHDDDTRGRHGLSTEVAASGLMLGETIVGLKLRHLRAAMGYLRGRPDLDPSRMILWGDSLAPPNPELATQEVPFDVEPFPVLAEPLGALLALVGALFEPEVRAVYARGGLVAFSSVLESPFCFVPFDSIVPGLLGAGDVSEMVSAVAPRPVRLVGLVDGRNQTVDEARLTKAFEAARAAYRSHRVDSSLGVSRTETRLELLRWMRGHLGLSGKSEQD